MMVKQSIGILGVDPGVVSWVGKEKRRDEILQARAKKLENFPRAFSSSDPANDCPWVDSKNEYFVAHLPCVDDTNERKILDAHQVLFACTGCLYSMSSIRLIDHWRSYFSPDIKTKLLTLTIQKLDHRINSSLYVTSAELWFWRFIYLFNREKYDVTLPWQQNFCISTIFLNICIVERWKKSMVYCFLPSCTGKSYTSFFPVFSAIFAGAQFVEVQSFWYHGNATWHSDFSSVLTCVGYLVPSLTH